MVTSLERIKSLLVGGPIDRVSVAAWQHFPQDDQNPTSLANATIRFQREYGWDLVKVTPAQTYLAELWGLESSYRGDIIGRRTITSQPISRIDDWADVLRPTLSSIGTSYFKAIEASRRGLGDECVILSTVFSPISIARYLAGDELLAASLRLRRDDVRRFLCCAAQIGSEVIRRAAEAGADGAFISLFMSGAAWHSFDDYMVLLEESEGSLLRSVTSGWFNVAHFHSVYPWLTSLAAWPSIQGLSWDIYNGEPSLEEVAVLCPEKVLIGGVDQRDWLLMGSSEEVAHRVRDIVRFSKDATGSSCANRLIIAPGCTISQETPKANLRALRNAVESVG